MFQANDLLRPLLTAALVAAAIACGDHGTSPDKDRQPPIAMTLTKISGDNQSVAAGATLPNPLVVKVKDQYGAAMSGVTVAWEVPTADGSVAATTTKTDGAGNASGRWTLGTHIGAHSLQASVVGISSTVTFTATATPGQVQSLSLLQDSLFFAALEDTARINVEATDQYGNPVPGGELSWSSHDSTVASVVNGLVTARGNGSTAIVAVGGDQSDTATVRVVQLATAASISAGDAQIGPADEALPVALNVNVADANGFGVAGVSVRWTPGATSGAVSADSLDTGPDGNAAVTWTLGLHSGTDTVIAAVKGFEQTPLVFTATATPNAIISGAITYTSELQSTGTVDDGGLVRSGSVSSGGLSRESRESNPVRPFAKPNRDFIPGSLIVTYRSNALAVPELGSRAYRSPVTARSVETRIRAELAAVDASGALQLPTGLRLRGISPALLAARISVPPERLDAVQAALLRSPHVASVERETLFYGFDELTGVTIPNDPYWRSQMWNYNTIDLPEAWNLTTGSSQVVVAIVDDGIRFDHPAISGNLTNDGYDFVSSGPVSVCGVLYDKAGDGDGYDADPTVPYKFDSTTCAYGDAHGLHVAGTIGATGNDGIGVTGVNWSVRLRPVRVLGIDGTGSNYDIAQGILYAAGLPADDGAGGTVQAPSAARIINLSVGGPNNSTVLSNAVTAATQAGALVVAAAGNGSTSTPYYPAAYSDVVSVSAVGPDWELASYSNFGSTVDIAAPGGDFSDGNATDGVFSTNWDFSTNSPTYKFLQGTSMAAPHVSGVAALLLAREPDLTVDQLRSRLLDYAVDLGTPGRDDIFGWGLLNARNSLTATHAPQRDLYVRLYDAGSGSIVSTVRAEPDGTYSFPGLEDGSYYVFAGLDREGDQLAGWPGRMWGAFGSGTASPVAIGVSGAGTYTAQFSVGWPYESEPNDALTEADELVVNGHLRAGFSSTTDVDVYRITVPEGQYTFETSGWTGACGYANESDTVLELLDANGQVLALNDNIDAAALNYCSRITASLDAGTYDLRVGYVSGGGLYRLYQIHAREGA